MEEDALYVVYVLPLGKNAEGLNTYHFFLSTNPDDVWAEGWEEIPACNMSNLTPSASKYTLIKELVTDMDLRLAQSNCCFSMSDCRDGCVALAWEDISQLDEYPEPLRIVVPYGVPLDDIEEDLAKRDMWLKQL